MVDDAFFSEPNSDPAGVDESEAAAVGALREHFELHNREVFFSRQLEVLFEGRWFHWVTNRAVRQLVDQGLVVQEPRELSSGATIRLLWHRGHRYQRREMGEVVALVDEYSTPEMGAAVGLQGELLVLEGFARRGFSLSGRETRSFGATSWTESAHNLDFVFDRDGTAYGVEVKNTLGYMDWAELLAKIRLCRDIGVAPVFVVRMMPKSWVYDVVKAGGFVLILKYQLYPLSHANLAKKVAERLGLMASRFVV